LNSLADPTRGFGAELRRWRRLAELSLTELGNRVGYSKSHLSKVENGNARPTEALAKACDDELGASGALVAVLDAGQSLRAAPAPLRPSGLPVVTKNFVGREEELARIDRALSDLDTATVVCVVHGMPGAGKTALALRAEREVSGRFPDGTLFLDLSLSGTAPAAGALGRLLRALGVPRRDIPWGSDGQVRLYAELLRGRRLLLVLDNARSAGQVTPLIPATPGCGVLITSRNRLNALDEAVHVPVTALPAGPAGELFRAVGGISGPDDDQAVARIVEYCGRLPLAVRIAAARFRSIPAWSLDDFADRLADEATRLDALSDGERSVSKAFGLSSGRLPPSQRRVLGLLTLYPGREIPVRAAAVLSGLPQPKAEQLLWQLSDAHLIVQRSGDSVAFHDLARLFAAGHVRPTLPVAEQNAATGRLLELTLSQAAACDRLLSPHRYRPLALTPRPPGQPHHHEELTSEKTALAWLNASWPDVVALCGLAHGHGLHENCWQLAFLLRDYFFRVKLWASWIDTHNLALASARLAGNDQVTAMTLNNLGMAHADRGTPEAALRYYGEAQKLFRSLADEPGAATTRSNLGWAHLSLGNYAAAMRQLTGALDFYQHSGAARNVMITLRGIALTEAETGSFTSALQHAELAQQKARELGLELDTAMAMNCIAWVNYQAARYREAADFYGQAMTVGERSGSRHEVARARTGLGNVAAVTSDHTQAINQWSQAGELTSGFGDIDGEARTRRVLERANHG